MRFTGPDLRVLHLRPTRRCNLECLHCYSTSGPAGGDTIATEIAASAVASAARLGYTMLSVSGGEPLLYRGLWAVLEEARRAGMIGAIVTNGVGITTTLAARLRDAVDVVAVSVDGRPDRHNRLRQHPTAFARTQQGLATLRAHGVHFKLLCSVSADSLTDLEWAAACALEHGASALQIHPIEPAGRAALLPRDEAPDETALKAYLVAERLRQVWKDRLQINIDVADLLSFACDVDAPASSASVVADNDLSAVVSPLVIEPTGDVVPLRYGFARRFAIGNIHDAPLGDLARVWLAEPARSFVALARGALAAAARQPCPFGNPYEIIANAASAAADSEHIYHPLLRAHRDPPTAMCESGRALC
jgi:MoaA/NifB/PqqE/SkfB family radical SAM enzyme